MVTIRGTKFNYSLLDSETNVKRKKEIHASIINMENT
jgi:hypothetical protein